MGSVIWTSVVRGRSPMSVLFRQPYDQRQLCRAAAKGCRHQNGADQSWQDGSRRRLAAEHLLGLVRGQLCQNQATKRALSQGGRQFDGVTVNQRPRHIGDRTRQPGRYLLADDFFLAAGLVPAAAFLAAAGFFAAGAAFAAGALFFFAAGREAATCAL